METSTEKEKLSQQLDLYLKDSSCLDKQFACPKCDLNFSNFLQLRTHFLHSYITELLDETPELHIIPGIEQNSPEIAQKDVILPLQLESATNLSSEDTQITDGKKIDKDESYPPSNKKIVSPDQDKVVIAPPKSSTKVRKRRDANETSSQSAQTKTARNRETAKFPVAHETNHVTSSKKSSHKSFILRKQPDGVESAPILANLLTSTKNSQLPTDFNNVNPKESTGPGGKHWRPSNKRSRSPDDFERAPTASGFGRAGIHDFRFRHEQMESVCGAAPTAESFGRPPNGCGFGGGPTADRFAKESNAGGFGGAPIVVSGFAGVPSNFGGTSTHGQFGGGQSSDNFGRLPLNGDFERPHNSFAFDGAQNTRESRAGPTGGGFGRKWRAINFGGGHFTDSFGNTSSGPGTFSSSFDRTCPPRLLDTWETEPIQSMWNFSMGQHQRIPPLCSTPPYPGFLERGSIQPSGLGVTYSAESYHLNSQSQSCLPQPFDRPYCHY